MRARSTDSEPAPSGSLAHGSSISCCVSHCLLQLLAGGSTSQNEDDPVLLSISSYAESGNRIAPTRAFGRRDSHGSVHDAHREDPTLAFQLAHLSSSPTQPTCIGVFRDTARPVYGEAMDAQIDQATAKLGVGDLRKLLHSGDTWTVK